MSVPNHEIEKQIYEIIFKTLEFIPTALIKLITAYAVSNETLILLMIAELKAQIARDGFDKPEKWKNPVQQKQALFFLKVLQQLLQSSIEQSRVLIGSEREGDQFFYDDEGMAPSVLTPIVPIESVSALDALKVLMDIGIRTERFVNHTFPKSSVLNPQQLIAAYDTLGRPAISSQVRSMLIATWLLAETHVAISLSSYECQFLSRIIMAWNEGQIPHKQELFSSRIDGYICNKGLDPVHGFVAERMRGSHVTLVEPDFLPAVAPQACTLYVHTGRTSTIKDLQSIPVLMKEWILFQIASSGQLSQRAHELLEIHEKLMKHAQQQWQSKAMPNIIEGYCLALKAIKEKTPALIAVTTQNKHSMASDTNKSLFVDSRKALAQLVKGLRCSIEEDTGKRFPKPTTQFLSLVTHLEQVRPTLSKPARDLAEQLVGGIMVVAGTHVRLEINDAVLRQLQKKTAKVAADKSSKTRSPEPDEQFRKQLNQWLGNTPAVSLITRENKRHVFYVQKTDKVPLEILKSAISDITEKLPAPSSSREARWNTALSFLSKKPTQPVPSSLPSITVPLNDYQQAIIAVIEKLQKYQATAERLGPLSGGVVGSVLMPFAAKKEQLCADLFTRFKARAQLVTTKEAGRDCLADLRIAIAQCLQEHTIIFASGIRDEARARKILETVSHEARQLMESSSFQATAETVPTSGTPSQS